MKLNPPPSPAERQISSRSDFIHRRWISSAIGGFSCKKHLLAQVLFAAAGGSLREVLSPCCPLASGGLSAAKNRTQRAMRRPVRIQLQTEKDEIALCAMKSERGSDEIFGVSPQMKLNPPPPPAVRQISSRSDFTHRRWISSAIGGFSCKKHLLAQVLFAVL